MINTLHTPNAHSSTFANLLQIKRNGNYCEYTAEVFPGILLDYYRCEGGMQWSYHTMTFAKRHDFFIGHCKNGRFEMLRQNGKQLSCGLNQIVISSSLCTSPPKIAIIPSIFYEGISVTVLYKKLPIWLHHLFLNWNIDFTELITRFGILKQWYLIDSHNEPIKYLMLTLYDLFEAGNVPMLQLKILELIFTVSCLNTAQNLDTTLCFSKSNITTVKKIRCMMLDAAYHQYPLSLLVKNEAIPYARFQKIFKELYGLSPNAYRLENKMNQAAVFLKNTEKSITEIGQEMGYNNTGKFSAMFKKIMGSSPVRYRRMNAERGQEPAMNCRLSEGHA